MSEINTRDWTHTDWQRFREDGGKLVYQTSKYTFMVVYV